MWVPPLELRLWNGGMWWRIAWVMPRHAAKPPVNPTVERKARSCWGSSIRREIIPRRSSSFVDAITVETTEERSSARARTRLGTSADVCGRFPEWSSAFPSSLGIDRDRGGAGLGFGAEHDQGLGPGDAAAAAKEVDHAGEVGDIADAQVYQRVGVPRRGVDCLDLGQVPSDP